MSTCLIAALPLLVPFAPQDPAPSAKPNSAADSAAAVAKREKAFAELLTSSELVGYTTITGGDGKLQSEELEKDSYSLTSVEKQDDGRWLFRATIHYGGTPIPIAFPLPVEWAGETPIISVTDMKVPFMGTYSARVMFHDDQYVGVWSGDGYGGHIFGQVVKPQTVDMGGGEDDEQAAVSWPQFRGPNASGVANGFELPPAFDVESGENIRWRIEVPGMSHSAPVIWGDKLFLVTAVRVDGPQELRVGLYGEIAPVEDESEFRFEVHCYDKGTGTQLWKRTAWTGVPAIKRHTKGSQAQSTPACDSKRVVAFFGSEGLYAFDHDGNPLWDRNFGVLDSGFFMVKTAQWGFASSPVLHDGKVIVQCDVQENSFLSVLDAATGKDVWRKERKEEPGWSTPTVHVGAERSQIICNGWKHIGGYDLATGDELWTAEPGGDIPVPTPVVAEGLTYITNSHGQFSPIFAIDLEATGHVSFADDEDEYLAWGTPRRGNYMQTPIVYGTEAYFCRDNGVLTCYDAVSGEKHYSERLDEGRSGYTGSPVASEGVLYFTSEEGTVISVLAGPNFEVIARSSLGEQFLSTPALSEGVLYFRSRGHLTAVGYD
ncbi:MAG: PQQ-binding-like beta-propeller repeat protein [Planctomycetota bacterium]